MAIIKENLYKIDRYYCYGKDFYMTDTHAILKERFTNPHYSHGGESPSLSFCRKIKGSELVIPLSEIGTIKMYDKDSIPKRFTRTEERADEIWDRYSRRFEYLGFIPTVKRWFKNKLKGK